MLRPIDTQTVYQQSQEVSNRQQMAKNETDMQQSQFSNIMHKETIQKQVSVNEVAEEEQIRSNIDKKNGRGTPEQQKKYKKKKEKDKNKNKEQKDKESTYHIDIRI